MTTCLLRVITKQRWQCVVVRIIARWRWRCWYFTHRRQQCSHWHTFRQRPWTTKNAAWKQRLHSWIYKIITECTERKINTEVTKIVHCAAVSRDTYRVCVCWDVEKMEIQQRIVSVMTVVPALLHQPHQSSNSAEKTHQMH